MSEKRTPERTLFSDGDVFSLNCCGCDAGGDIVSPKQAAAGKEA